MYLGTHIRSSTVAAAAKLSSHDQLRKNEKKKTKNKSATSCYEEVYKVTPIAMRLSSVCYRCTILVDWFFTEQVKQQQQ